MLEFDLEKLMSSRSTMFQILTDLQRELAIMEAKQVSHVVCSTDIQTNSSPEENGPAKPRTMPEYRRLHATNVDHSAVAGAAVMQISSSMPTFELQYLVFFAIYVSAELRQMIATHSPEPVQRWLEHFRFYFERHITCMHDTQGTHETLFGTQGVVEFVMSMLLRIKRLYA